MVITRADTLTSTIKKQEFFSDFLDSFATTPMGGDLGRVINERAVTQSIKNLIWTNLGERLFQPNVGSKINNSLFEMNDFITLNGIKTSIQNTIRYNEPRCNLISIEANSTDEHTISVSITYALINNPTPITFNLMLQRVR
jgi:phage baseplate assembly protein W